MRIDANTQAAGTYVSKEYSNFRKIIKIFLIRMDRAISKKLRFQDRILYYIIKFNERKIAKNFINYFKKFLIFFSNSKFGHPLSRYVHDM